MTIDSLNTFIENYNLNPKSFVIILNDGQIFCGQNPVLTENNFTFFCYPIDKNDNYILEYLAINYREKAINRMKKSFAIISISVALLTNEEIISSNFL